MALASHPAGHYRADRDQLDGAFSQVVRGVRAGSIRLDYVPSQGVWMDIPPISHHLHLQALVYWCVEFNCGLDAFIDAYASAGSQSLIHDVYLRVTQGRRLPRLAHWLKTVAKPSALPETVPMQPRSQTQGMPVAT